MVVILVDRARRKREAIARKRDYAIARVARNGRTTVPVFVRRELGIPEGGDLAFVRSGKYWVISGAFSINP